MHSNLIRSTEHRISYTPPSLANSSPSLLLLNPQMFLRLIQHREALSMRLHPRIVCVFHDARAFVLQGLARVQPTRRRRRPRSTRARHPTSTRKARIGLALRVRGGGAICCTADTAVGDPAVVAGELRGVGLETSVCLGVEGLAVCSGHYGRCCDLGHRHE